MSHLIRGVNTNDSDNHKYAAKLMIMDLFWTTQKPFLEG